MPITTAIILAGGLGTRLRGILPTLPKPMAPIKGRPFLEYQMDYWIDQGISHFILSVGYLREAIIDHFKDSYKSASIEYVIENNPLGTGGGLLLAAKQLTDPFLVLNGDTFIEVNLENLHSFHLNSKSDWTFSLVRVEVSDRYMPINIDKNGLILSLKSKNRQASVLVNGGVYLINPNAVERLHFKAGDNASLEDELLPNFISSGGSLYGVECKGRFIDIGIPKDYLRASDILE